MKILLLLLLLYQGANRTELIKMRRSLLICLAIAGAVSDSERVEVKSAENVTLRVERPGNVRLVTLKNCEKRTGDPIIRYCSPEEEKSGCTAKESDRFSINFDTESLSVTCVDARVSDEGCYVVSYIDVANKVKEKFFNFTVHESLEPPKDFPIKGRETPWKISLIMLAVGIPLTAVVILAFILVINCQKQKKKKNNPEADDDAEGKTLNSNTNEAGKPTTDESLEMVELTKCSVDNDNQRSKKDLNHGA